MSMCTAGGGEDSCHVDTSVCAGDDEPPLLCAASPAIETMTCRPNGWDDWRWQMANRIRTPQQLSATFPRLTGSKELASVMAKYPMAITPYYASLMRRADSSDPIFQMCVPRIQELTDPPFLT